MPTPSPNDTKAVYERQAASYDAQRSRTLFEARWLARFAAQLPKGGHVLDLGCGAGEPIAAWFIAQGFSVTGVDFADAMLKLARARWPQGDWRHDDMTTLDLGQTFDGLVSWDSFFHLTPSAQRSTLPRMAAHLKPGGSLLITVGPSASQGQGTVGGEAVYHASLSAAEYATLLESCGMRLTGYLAQDPETDKHTVLMAHKDKG